MGVGEVSGFANGRGQLQLLTAAYRALEALGEHPLVDDPYARTLVTAADNPYALSILSATDERTRFLTDCAAIQTRFYDDALLAATTKGAQQVVLLAGGLDTRAYRLPWPPGTVIYEIGDPALLVFKTRVIDELGSTPRADHRLVGAGVEADWQSSLSASGFDPDVPTAWLAEMVVSHIAEWSHDNLFERVIELSAPGSCFFADSDPLVQTGTTWRGFVDAVIPNPDAVDLSILQSYDNRTLPGDWLSGHGWVIETVTSGETAQRYGRRLRRELGEIVDYLAGRKLMYATLPVSYLD